MRLVKLFGEDISITEEGFEDEVNRITTLLHDIALTESSDCLESTLELMNHYRDMLEAKDVDCASLEHTLIEIIECSLWMYSVVNKHRFSDTVAALRDTLIRKNKDYGNSSIKNGGLVGNYVRMSDKVSRIENLSSKKSANYESISDTWLDLAGYAVLGIIILRLTKAVTGENG